jgi:hypothetical protein
VKSVSRRRFRVVVGAFVAVLVLNPVVASADRLDDHRTELVRRQIALIHELDELAATDAELTDALAMLDLWMVVQATEVERTQAELVDATLATRRARAAEQAKADEVADLEDLMATMAVNAYVQPPTADFMSTFRSSSAPGEAARLGVYLDVKAQRDTDLVHRLRRAREQLARLRERTRDAERRARAASEDASSTLADLSTTRGRFAEIQVEVQDRQRGAAHESTLVALDLGRANQWLAAEAGGQRARGLPLVDVRGITVHRAIAGQLELMLAAAEADGVRLGGGGFRTHTQQIELRRAHCGDDPHSIFERPAGECSPPTARPGNSMHEIGLAIDFTYNGVSIDSRTNPGFRWLAENAHLYGFFNLPSEPWHWSVNGS